jgi:ABC-type sulfate/molybdate transport systems ATPase subunit
MKTAGKLSILPGQTTTTRSFFSARKRTSVFVTHDQEEAMEVADRVVVMSQGNIEQVDEPEQLWREPATRFVLEFMGEVNLTISAISLSV